MPKRMNQYGRAFAGTFGMAASLMYLLGASDADAARARGPRLFKNHHKGPAEQVSNRGPAAIGNQLLHESGGKGGQAVQLLSSPKELESHANNQKNDDGADKKNASQRKDQSSGGESLDTGMTFEEGVRRLAELAKKGDLRGGEEIARQLAVDASNPEQVAALQQLVPLIAKVGQRARQEGLAAEIVGYLREAFKAGGGGAAVAAKKKGADKMRQMAAPGWADYEAVKRRRLGKGQTLDYYREVENGESVQKISAVEELRGIKIKKGEMKAALREIDFLAKRAKEVAKANATGDRAFVLIMEELLGAIEEHGEGTSEAKEARKKIKKVLNKLTGDIQPHNADTAAEQGAYPRALTKEWKTIRLIEIQRRMGLLDKSHEKKVTKKLAKINHQINKLTGGTFSRKKLKNNSTPEEEYVQGREIAQVISEKDNKKAEKEAGKKSRFRLFGKKQPSFKDQLKSQYEAITTDGQAPEDLAQQAMRTLFLLKEKHPDLPSPEVLVRRNVDTTKELMPYTKLSGLELKAAKAALRIVALKHPDSAVAVGLEFQEETGDFTAQSKGGATNQAMAAQSQATAAPAAGP